MLKIFRPLQLSLVTRVLEQNRKFYFIVSATLGIDLQTGKTLLDLDYLKDSIECLGKSTLPDIGNPKPRGEALVSGKCFAPKDKSVPARQVNMNIGPINKSLYVFGNRYWNRKGGTFKVISDPDPFIEMEISYENAFGGFEYANNRLGKGLPVKTETGEVIQPLPNVENPKKLIGSPGDRPDPVGFSALNPLDPFREKYQGTYDKNYKQNYFPGYPEDLDWHYFMNAPQDQWIKGYWKGNEAYEISHMHPEIQVIKGQLPNLYPRCFIRHSVNGSEPKLMELIPMNLDTIWFFPEKLLALLIWRKGIEVGDDEAEQVTHVLGAYEDKAYEPRTLEYYRKALEFRMTGDEAFLANFTSEDLIPEGHKCAMELLQEMAFADSDKGEFAKNMDAKTESMKKMMDEKVEDTIQNAEKSMENDVIPDKDRVDLRKLFKEASEADPDPDVKALNQKLESILPGITAGDPGKLELKKFSFDKLDQIMESVGEFTDKKEKEAKDTAKKEIEKMKVQFKEQIGNAQNSMENMPDDSKENIEESLKVLEDLDLDKVPKGPLPRLNADDIIAQISQVSPQVMDAVQHLKSVKEIGAEDENTIKLEKQVQEILDEQNKKTEDALHQAEKDFKDVYIMSAHFMKDCLSPHKDPVKNVADKLLRAISEGEDVSNGDWACVDLSGKKFDGVDFSGCFLEQVNFQGASLKGANLSNAILARANLVDADLAGANLEESNIGGVCAHWANFTGANLKSAKLSKGDFTDADFTGCEMDSVECLEVILNRTDFSKANIPGLMLIKIEVVGTKFTEASLDSGIFFNCNIKGADFSGAVMPKCIFADTRFENVRFDRADLTSNCFLATDPEKSVMDKVSFKKSCLEKSNFMGLIMHGADLSTANMERSCFIGADLSKANLTRANAKEAMLRKARLAGAKLDEINLIEGSLAKAYLVKASFLKANLYAVDFLRSTITNTDFRGSNLDQTLIENWRPK